MAEWKLVADEVPYVSTAEFHADRTRAPHLEQPAHRPRLEMAAEFAREAAARIGPAATVSDLGCGDGGLLSLLRPIESWGYDFQPSNEAGWVERGVTAERLDIFNGGADQVKFGDVTTITEVLEHLADPHAVVRWIGEHSKAIVASSPWVERPHAHDECHAWAFDPAGYRALIEQAGFIVQHHRTVGMFQVILGWQVAR